MLAKPQTINLKIAYFLSFVSELFFPIAIWLFFYSRYLNFQQIAIITAVGSLASILLEVPTGAFADLVGRKTAITLSYFLWSIAMFFTAYSHTLFTFLILAIVNGLVNAMCSSSLEAIVYDTLKENHQASRYDQVTSQMQALTWIGLFIGSILGGFMFKVWFRLPYLAQAVVALMAAFLSLKLYEPKIDSHRYSFKNFIVQNSQGFRELFKSSQATKSTLIFITLGAGYHIAASILGISQGREYGMQPEHVGLLFASGYLVASLASHYYPKLKAKFSTRSILALSSIILIGSFILAKFVGLIIGAFLIFMRIASSTIFRNTQSIILNKSLSSKNRATSLSTMTLLTQLPYTVLAYFIGDYIDKTSPNSLAFILGISLIFILTLIGFSITRQPHPQGPSL